MSDENKRFAPPQRNEPGLPVTGNDDAILAMLVGAQFNAPVTLPSGKTIDTQQAQTWTDLYRE